MSLLVFNIPVKVIPPTFPAGYCPTAQQLANDLASGLIFQLPGPYSGLIISETEPAVKDRDKLWLRLFGSSGPADRFYFYDPTYGWIWPHEVSPSSNRRILLECTEADVKTEDGGEDVALTLAAGPFWSIDTNYAGRSPMGPGAVGDTTVALGANEGEATEAIAADMIKHFHGTGASIGPGMPIPSGVPDAPAWVNRSWSIPSGIATLAQDWTEGPAIVSSSTISSGDRGTTDSIASEAESDELPVLHPVRGVYHCKRTIRKYYKPSA